MIVIAYLVSGLLFGVGLFVAGLVDPAKVLSFLDITGAWDPSLALTLFAAVAVTFVGYRLVLTRPAPILDQCFHVPPPSKIDSRLVVGALVFGTGWGLVGFCPGPALASLGFGAASSLLFTAAMLIGMALARFVIASAAAAKPLR